MDWRHNQWVGIFAAIFVIGGIGVLFWWMNRPPLALGENATGPTFQCESTKETFRVPLAALENAETYQRFQKPYGSPVQCEQCDNVDAYQVYKCEECGGLYYKYKPGEEASNVIRCPKGHLVPDKDQ